MSESLADFLIERISEDEAIGRDWVRNRGKVEVHGGGTGYLALVNSDRVLAECAAKRRIVELHAATMVGQWMNPLDAPAYLEEEWSCDVCGWFPTGSGCDTLRALATIYADHPDFDPTWSLT
jgi:hypothetical protein